MDEQAITRAYIEKSDEELRLFCSYATRREGFLDILLSGFVMSSEEARGLLGKVKTHRGSSMSFDREERLFNVNNYISLSTGFVSHAYSDPSVMHREDFVGGLGVLVLLNRVLEFPYLQFSHSSETGGIKNYKLNRDNIKDAVHKSRKDGELYDDGYGNIFEVELRSEVDENRPSIFEKVISYTRLELKDCVVAIPEQEKGTIINELYLRQESYKQLLSTISKYEPEELRWKHIDGRQFWEPQKALSFIERLVQPFDIDELPVFWYPHRNLDVALQYLSIKQDYKTITQGINE